MPDPNFHELLGDDGEFKDPVNIRYGVYSPRQRGMYWRWSVPMLVLSLCACGVIALIWYG